MNIVTIKEAFDMLGLGADIHIEYYSNPILNKSPAELPCFYIVDTIVYDGAVYHMHDEYQGLIASVDPDEEVFIKEVIF